MESDEGANYRWGDVKQPGKRSRTDGQTGKPPEGYKCKICESPDVSRLSATARKDMLADAGNSTSLVTAPIARSPKKVIYARSAMRYPFVLTSEK